MLKVFQKKLDYLNILETIFLYLKDEYIFLEIRLEI